jgi:hypothetical protein
MNFDPIKGRIMFSLLDRLNRGSINMWQGGQRCSKTVQAKWIRTYEDWCKLKFLVGIWGGFLKKFYKY